MSTHSDSCPQKPPIEISGGMETAFGLATVAKSVQASGCNGSDSVNSRRSDGELKSPSVAKDGKSMAAQRGESVRGDSVVASEPESAVKGHKQEETTSYRKEEAAHRTETQRTKRQQRFAPNGRDVIRSISTGLSVDSLDPTHRATSPARNEEIGLGLPGRRFAAAGEGDPPYGQAQVGRPTKPKPFCNGGDMPNSDFSRHEKLAPLLTSQSSKQLEHKTPWRAVDWEKAHALIFNKQRAIYRAFSQGNYQAAHRLQTRLLNSFLARLLAVKKATEDSTGAATPGTDGLASLTDAQKWRLTEIIRFETKPGVLRRIYIPKANKNELRPLGIPTIGDRAIQHLIKLALEPAAETLLAPEQFGFRPGRSCWDATAHIRLRCKTPTYVLDADVRQFFDRIDHDSLLRDIPGPPRLIKAIRRIIKAGILDGSVLTQPVTGTPQGGPLSPLLANLVLANLASDIRKEFPKGRSIGGEQIVKPPYTPSYADDFLVIHRSFNVLMEVRAFVQNWFALRGLELHPDKTAIRHTAMMADGYRGFRFLGFGFRHHKIGRHQNKGQRDFLWTGPSKESLNRVYQEFVAIIEKSKCSKKHDGANADRARKGKATQEEIMVIRLNRLINGWCNYHRAYFAKETFSKLDHLLFKKLWKWALRRYPNRRRAWVVSNLFNNGKPWQFTVTSARDGLPLVLRSAAAIPVVRHFPVKAEKSWFDGDWAYWAKRTGHYPTLTARAGKALKRQSGKCPVCREVLISEAHVCVVMLPHQRGTKSCVIHRQCAVALPNVHTEPAFVGNVADRSPVQGNLYAGFGAPSVSQGTDGATFFEQQVPSCTS